MFHGDKASHTQWVLIESFPRILGASRKPFAPPTREIKSELFLEKGILLLTAL